MPDSSIQIVAYDPSWPGAFAAERRVLQLVLQPWLAGEIEHVGSTAVPGLAAKPVLDLMAPVHSLARSHDAIAAVAAAGYLYHPYQGDRMHWFCKPSPEHRTHHLHLVQRDSALWAERLAFRDALRRDASLASAYGQLKRQLAAQLGPDREAYTEAKGPFIQAVLAARGPEGGSA